MVARKANRVKGDVQVIRQDLSCLEAFQVDTAYGNWGGAMLRHQSYLVEFDPHRSPVNRHVGIVDRGNIRYGLGGCLQLPVDLMAQVASQTEIDARGEDGRGHQEAQAAGPAHRTPPWWRRRSRGWR